MSKIKNREITVVLPVHELDDTTKQLFDNAIASIKNLTVKPSEVLIITPKGSEANKHVKTYDFDSIKAITRIVENEGDTDFCSQVNLGVSKAKSEWVSILEYDDEYSTIWFKNANEYISAYPDVSIFMPIIADTNASNQFVGTTNEAVWAYQFSDDLGYLDTTALLQYQSFNIDGMVFKKSIIDEFGGFKQSIQLTFAYEFLLRMTYNDVKVMTVPKIGYKHINLREGSLFSKYTKTMDVTESRWWLSQAKKEYYWNEDRKITYKSNEAQ